MAIHADVKFKGLTKLDKTLERLPAKVKQRLIGAASLEMAKVARHTARRLVPVRTGKLKRSIRVRRKVVKGPDGVRRRGAQLQAGARWASHASLQEYGFRHFRSGKMVKAQPYVRPALRKHRGRMLRAAQGRISRLLPRAVKAAQSGG